MQLWSRGLLGVPLRAQLVEDRVRARSRRPRRPIGSHAQRRTENARRSPGRGPGSGVYGSSSGAGWRGISSSPSITPASGSTMCSRSSSTGRKVPSPPVEARGLIAAGGEATRLGELTRVANKHLLPVGRWPMIYYPLQLLQLAGIREVLIVTGQGHAGQLIDLLGDGRMPARGSEQPMFELDLTYKVQTEPGGIAQVVGMAEGFAGGGKLVVCLGDNLFEFAEVDAIREWVDGGAGRADLRQGGPRPRALRRRRVRRGRAGERRRREGGGRRHALRVAADVRRGRRPLLLRRRASTSSSAGFAPRAAASSRSRTSTARTRSRVASTFAAFRAGGTTRARTRRSRSSVRSSRRPGRTSPHEGRRGDPAPAVRGRARLVRRARARVAAGEAVGADERLVLARGRDPRAALPRARPGRPVRLPPRDRARRRARPRERRDVHRGHRRREPGRRLHPGPATRTASKR